MGSGCLLVIWARGWRRLPGPPARTSPFIALGIVCQPISDRLRLHARCLTARATRSGIICACGASSPPGRAPGWALFAGRLLVVGWLELEARLLAGPPLALERPDVGARSGWTGPVEGRLRARDRPDRGRLRARRGGGGRDRGHRPQTAGALSRHPNRPLRAEATSCCGRLA